MIIPKYQNTKNIRDRNNYYFDGVFYFYITKNKQIQKYNVSHELQLLNILPNYLTLLKIL